MAQFSIKTVNAWKTVTEEENLIRELGGLKEEIRHINSSLGFRITSSAQIRSRLKGAAENVGMYQRQMNGMKSALGDVINAYTSTEDAILGNLNGGKWWDALKNIVGIPGVIGDVGVLIGNFVTGDKAEPKTWAGLLKDGWNAGWDIGDAVKTCHEHTDIKWWQALSGFYADDFLKSIKNANLSSGQKFMHGLRRGTVGTLRGIKKDLKTGVGRAKQVGGIVVSGIVNGVSNYGEYKSGEISGGRAVAETISETAVDWGKNFLIGAGVTAAFAAAGIAAPAIAVGAATVAISVGADWVCKQVCGKPVTEAVSDLILDTGARAIQGAKDSWNSAKKDVEVFWKGVTGSWDAFTNNIGMAFA